MANKSKQRAWTRDEAILVLYLYCRIPFAQSKSTHPEVIRVAKLIRRSPAAVNMRIGNFGSLDPSLQVRGVVGLRHSSALVESIWHEFQNDWRALAQAAHKIETDMKARQGRDSTEIKIPIGKEKHQLTRKRINQNFFRQTILAAYDERCCVTGIDVKSLLIASHIKAWAKCDKTEKLNPHNGLCLNALHDRAFDRGLMTIDCDYRIRLSDALHTQTNATMKRWFSAYAGKKITLPEKFAPSLKFLDWHTKYIFQDSV